MLYLKAIAVGIVTGVLALAVAGVIALAFGGYYVIGTGVDIHIHDTYFAWPGSPEPLVKQFAVGFGIGFLFMLWRAMVKHQAGSTSA